MVVNFISPDGRYDDIYLSNFATINVRDELLRVYGVSDINYLGQRDYSIRIWLDPQKLASRGMTAMDVANAIRTQNLDAPAGRIGQPPSPAGQSSQLPIDALARLSEPDQFGDIIVKVDQATAPTPSYLTTESSQQTVSQLNQGATQISAFPSSGSGSATGSSTSGMLQIDTTLVDAVTQLERTGTPNIAPPTVRPTMRLGAVGGAATTSDATSSAAITTITPQTVTITGGGTAGGGATTVGGASTGGGATAAVSATSTSSSGGAAATFSQRIGGALNLEATRTTTTGMGPPNPSDAMVRLRDVARLELGAQNYNQSCLFDGHPSVGLAIYQLPGTNALDVAERVQAKMKELKARFPDGVDYNIAYDTTPFIRDSV